MSQPLGSPCGMRLPQSCCVSQPFARLLWYWYSLWSNWLLTGLWTWLAPGGSSRFWYLASCWIIVHFLHTTWVKGKLPWLGGISLAIRTCGASFGILSKSFAASFWDIVTYSSLTSHDFCDSLSGAWPTLLWRREHSWNFRKAKGDKKVEIKLEGFLGLGVFVVSTLSLLHGIGFSNGLLNPPSGDLINFIDDDCFLSPNFFLLRNEAPQNSVKTPPPPPPQ